MRPTFLNTIALMAMSVFGSYTAEEPVRRPKFRLEPAVREGKGHARSAPHQGQSYRRGWPKHLAPSRAWHVCRRGV
jgi:hypothetical protein